MTMSIREFVEKVKSREFELFLIMLILTTAFLAYGLGRLSKIEQSRQPVQIEQAKSL